jgi:PAS domain-containing protein
MSGPQKPLELILARNLLTSVTTPAFLVARDGTLLFYNEGAGALIGRPFEDIGQLDLDEWTRRFGPFDDDDEPLPFDRLPLTRALKHRIAASAMPIVGAASGASGAMVIFWPVDENQAREVTTGRHEVAS